MCGSGGGVEAEWTKCSAKEYQMGTRRVFSGRLLIRLCYTESVSRSEARGNSFCLIGPPCGEGGGSEGSEVVVVRVWWW